MSSGHFEAVPGSIEGKFLAEEHADAMRWGLALYGARPFHVVQVSLPHEAAAALMRWASLDGIGPARYAEIDQLILAVVLEVNS